MKKFLLMTFILFFSSAEGCKENIKERLQKRQLRLTEDFETILNSLKNSMITSIPQNSISASGEDLLLKWRVEPLKKEIIDKLKEILSKIKDPSSREIIKETKDFLENQMDFWNGDLNFKKYGEIISDKEKKGKHNVIKELSAFDRTFAHAQGFYRALKLDAETRASFYLKYMEDVFDFRRKGVESVAEYLERLCRTNLNEFCRVIPFEFIPQAIEKPYLEGVIGKIENFKKNYGGSKLSLALDLFKKDIEKRIAQMQGFPPEDPFLPDSISKKSFTYDLLFKITEKEILFEGIEPLNFEEGFIFDKDKKRLKEYENNLKTTLEKLTEERGPENMVLSMFETHLNTPFKIVNYIGSILKEKGVLSFAFAGRRRIDGINKKVISGVFDFVKDTDKKIIKIKSSKLQGSCKIFGKRFLEGKKEEKSTKIILVQQTMFFQGDYIKGKIPAIEEMKSFNPDLKYNYIIGVAQSTPYKKIVEIIDPLFSFCKDNRCNVVEETNTLVELYICNMR